MNSHGYEWLGYLYSDGKYVKKDNAKAAVYYSKALELGFDSGRILKGILDGREYIPWQTLFHPFFLFGTEEKEELDSKIVLLLLISKNRQLSKNITSKILVKGIALKVIESLANELMRQVCEKKVSAI